MRVIVLVNNFNYGEFVGEALQSLLAQTKSPDEIIVIDDGSTDGSAENISKYCDKYDNIKTINKENAGQLSCFNVAAPYIANDDIVFFLDSDDLYPVDYIELVLSNVDTNHDFYFAEVVRFNKLEAPLVSSRISSANPCSIYKSSALTRRYNTWIGSPTSAITMKGAALKEVLPYHDERNFRTRADDVLIFSSSILGQTKKYLPFLAVAYRFHGNNNFFGKEIKADSSRYFALEKLFNEMCRRAGLGLSVPISAAYAEAMCIPPNYRKKFFLPPAWLIHLHRSAEKAFKLIGLR